MYYYTRKSTKSKHNAHFGCLLIKEQQKYAYSIKNYMHNRKIYLNKSKKVISNVSNS